jgi:hypothetical protein
VKRSMNPTHSRSAGHIHQWLSCNKCTTSYCSKCVGGKCPRCGDSYYAEPKKRKPNPFRVAVNRLIKAVQVLDKAIDDEYRADGYDQSEPWPERAAVRKQIAEVKAVGKKKK